MKTMNFINRCIVCGMVILGFIALLSGIFTERWYLYFIGITSLILGYIMVGDDNEEKDDDLTYE